MSRGFAVAFLLSTMAVVSLSAVPVGAAPFTNGGFELGAFDVNDPDHVLSLQPGSTAITGWTVISAETAWGRNDNPYVGPGATEGTLFLDLTGFHDSLPYGGVSQTFDTTPGQSLVLGFDLISLEGSAVYRGPVSVSATAGNTTQTFTFASPLPVTGLQHQRFTMPFTATGTSTTVSFTGTLATGGQFLGLDNVTIPEPASLAVLLTAAGAGSVVRRRRRR